MGRAPAAAAPAARDFANIDKAAGKKKTYDPLFDELMRYFHVPETTPRCPIAANTGHTPPTRGTSAQVALFDELDFREIVRCVIHGVHQNIYKKKAPRNRLNKIVLQHKALLEAFLNDITIHKLISKLYYYSVKTGELVTGVTNPDESAEVCKSPYYCAGRAVRATVTGRSGARAPAGPGLKRSGY
ncbi:hypothetical protein EVAR_53698_1 [Eumeta japonica]|uniref:Uncharacterized protein n=1 Tax=Eumeta variegata TaxID=151549 RepID=A0A4C1ZEI8_EUMVA|nr:hypothetical protein EVAR_53698_1 [Eumeta japonica]